MRDSKPASPIPCAEIVGRIRGGEAAGMEHLYFALSEAAIGRLSRTVDAFQVEDKLHDIVVTVVEAIRNGTLREPDRLMGFIQTITRRRIAAHIRQKIQTRRRLSALDPNDCPTGAEQSPDHAVNDDERRRVLVGALSGICARDREILTRFYLDEQEPARICREMKLTSTQFRLYKSRAVARCSEQARERAN